MESNPNPDLVPTTTSDYDPDILPPPMTRGRTPDLDYWSCTTPSTHERVYVRPSSNPRNLKVKLVQFAGPVMENPGYQYRCLLQCEYAGQRFTVRLKKGVLLHWTWAAYEPPSWETADIDHEQLWWTFLDAIEAKGRLA